MPAGTPQQVSVGYLPHPEGAGGLDLVLLAREAARMRLHLFTSPHFARLSLVGRPFHEVPALVSCACATSAVSHQITAIQAIEVALGIQPSPQAEAIRRILTFAQWIQGHALHIHFLAAPGLLGYTSSVALASAYPEIVHRALRLRKLGMEMTGAVGGRRVAPLALRVGGSYRIPSRAALDRVRARLERARADVTDTVALVSSLSLPPLARSVEHVALQPQDGYPANSGQIVSTRGLAISAQEYGQHFRKREAPGRGSFCVGPLARLNLNRFRLGRAAAQALDSCGLALPSLNPLASVVARAVELVQAVEECSMLIGGLDLREEDVRFGVAAGEGAAVTEAPRGLLYHRYRLDGNGVVQEAEVVSPTSHNLCSIEEDLCALAHTLDLSSDDLKLRLEMVLRSYDPCATCSRDVPGMSLCLDA